MAAKTLFAQLWDGLGNAIADIRKKVVEEPWFGRAVTDDHTPAPHWPEARQPNGEAAFRAGNLFMGGYANQTQPGPEITPHERNAAFRAGNLFLGGYTNQTKAEPEPEHGLDL